MSTGVTLAAMGLVIALACVTRPQPPIRARAESAPQWPRWIALGGLAVVAPVLAVAGVAGRVVWRAHRRVRAAATSARRRVADFPDALDLLVLAIRAGYLPAQAIVEVVPFLPATLRPAFASVGAAMHRGERFADALRTLEADVGTIAQPLVDSLAAAERYGSPLTPVLERLAFESRQQRRRDADASARELPVRLAVPLVVCTLPSFVLLAIVPLLLGALSSLHT
jgi:tight adherence protein C